MKVIRLMFFLLAPVFALYLGFRAGLISSSGTGTGTASAESGVVAGPSTNRSPQFNLLIVGVSSSGKGAELQSAWLMGYHPSNPNAVSFVPLYPLEQPGSEQLANSLLISFSLGSDGYPNGEFYQLLQGIYGISWDGALVLSSADVAEAINVLGGLENNGEIMTGEQVTGLLKSAGYSLSSQGAVIKGVCDQVVHSTDTSRLAKFSRYIVQRINVSSETQQIVSEMIPSLILNPRLKCDFPTLPGN